MCFGCLCNKNMRSCVYFCLRWHKQIQYLNNDVTSLGIILNVYNCNSVTLPVPFDAKRIHSVTRLRLGEGGLPKDAPLGTRPGPVAEDVDTT